MQSQLESQTQDMARRYVAGEISLTQFQDWFVPISWDIETTGDHSAIHLAHQIDGLLAEASSANWVERDLREELGNAVRSFADSVQS